jgi:amidase
MLGHEYKEPAKHLSPQLTALIQSGLGVEKRDYRAAMKSAEQARDALRDIFARYDAILAPSAPGAAPEGLDATGDPIFSRMWNLLHAPSVALPVTTDEKSLPVGIQLIGAFGHDRRLLAIAKWAAGHL